MKATTGKIVQVTGPVVDIQFPDGDLPNILTALSITNKFIDENTVSEKPIEEGSMFNCSGLKMSLLSDSRCP